eukprot:jgi/Ulvmu1/4824/UM020_0109.1
MRVPAAMAEMVDVFLQPMGQEEFAEYHARLIDHVTQTKACIQVVPDTGDGKGKGVLACQAIQGGARIFTEAPLVGEQHIANRQHALVCDQCFRYVGPLELQLGFRLLSVAGHGAANDSGDTAGLHEAAQSLLAGELAVPPVDWEPEAPAPKAVRASDTPVSLRSLLHCCRPCTQQHPQQQDQEQRDISLLGKAVMLDDGSDWMFCSHDCAALAWVTWAAALSPGPRQQLPPAVKNCTFVETFESARLSAHVRQACSLGGSLDTFPAVQAGPSSTGACCRPAWLQQASDAEAVRQFYEHAAGSNDIFRVAARAVALVGSAACMFEAACAAGACEAVWAGQAMGARAAALRFAWQPFKAIMKAVWWEHVPMPADLEDENKWREELREMACDSLALLKAALPDSFPQELLHERVWGSIIGMFELNNLDLQVQSPVELFFLACDELPEPRRAEVLQKTSAWLDALDTDYDACVEGTALYSLQSCMNHSQEPNASALKEDYDMDGRAVICAERDISPGEEVCITYIDLSAPDSAQRAALRDYGITLA